ncbi:glutamine amidotransferase-related protein, partial [Staphylococcus aureus]|uniref:glutamine amidotransferase-related protein n=1 Tax=Staphylococcus aureus TaxID=1280 RepID=UPI00065B4A26
EHVGDEVVVSNATKINDQAETIILPCVGHFKDAMSEIKRLNLNAILAKNTDKKMIGICLGMQLMYEHSDEGVASGVGFIPVTI